jgi:CHAT domain-containing protein
VYGSLWTVPDSETSLLMFMVHHYLVRERLGPAEALHAAQLWMLDPARVAPASMPADLAALTGSASLARPTAWAAFTHLGR